MHNRRRKCEIASKCTKTAGQILADIAEQTVTPVLATQFEDVEIDICGSLLYLFSVYAKLTSHRVKPIHDVGFRLTASFVFSSDMFCSIMTLSI